MPRTTDFLDSTNPHTMSSKQPTDTSITILWTLSNFAEHKPLTVKLAYEKQLRQCRLDYSLNSLKRIDRLLDTIRTKLAPDITDFYEQEDTRTFLYLLAFYCGEMQGRLRQIAPIWSTWEEFTQANQGMEQIIPADVSSQWLCSFVKDDGNNDNPAVNYFVPLVAIIVRLFEEEPDKSVYFSTIAGDVSTLNHDIPLSKAPPQTLAFDMQQALKQTPKSFLAYLQILPPLWMHTDSLMGQVKDLPKLYGRGRVVWGALVQANNELFNERSSTSYPAEILYDVSGRSTPQALKTWAAELFALKNTNPDDPELLAYVNHISAEHTRLYTRIPTSITPMPVYSVSIFIWRPHLPNGTLTLPCFPILISDDSQFATILPAYYWSHSAFYQLWIDTQQAEHEYKEQQRLDTSIQDELEEITPYVEKHTHRGFLSLLQNNPDFWVGYEELLYPQKYELPVLNQSALPAPPNPIDITAQKADTDYIEHCKVSAQSDYHRWYELKTKPSAQHIDDCLQQLQSGQPCHYNENVQKYAKLILIDWQAFLALLAQPLNNTELPNSLPLPKIATALACDNLPFEQMIKMVRFLMQQGQLGVDELLNKDRSGQTTLALATKNNTTALLYLAYIYATGKHGISQSIKEASKWLNYASSLGDYRATRAQAEWILAVPKLTYDLVGERLHSDASSLTMSLMNKFLESGVYFDIVKMDEDIEAYANSPAAQKEIIRQKLQLASTQQDSSAQARLQQLVEAQIIPASAPYRRVENIQYWIQNAVQNRLDTLNKSQLHTQSSSHQTRTQHKQQAKSASAWSKRNILVGLLVFIAGASWLFMKSQPVADTALQLSSADNMVNTTQASSANSINDFSARSTQLSETNQTHLVDIVQSIQQKLPQTLGISTENVLTELQHNEQSVTAHIQSQSKGMMNLQSAEYIVCNDGVFQPFKQASTEVILVITTQDNLSYNITVPISQC